MRFRLNLLTFCALFSLLLSSHPAHAARKTSDLLTLQAGELSLKVTLAELKRKLRTFQIEVDDPVYANRRKFDAFRLEDVLALLGQADTKTAADEIVFQASDGYAPSIARARLEGHPAYLAYAEHGRARGTGRFEKIRQGKTLLSPAPFYLIWAEGKKIGEEYPWPYQLVRIELVSFRKKYAGIFPTWPTGPSESKTDSPELRGFLTFKNQCIRCHSINLTGGDIGPELNTPKNVLEYWNEKTLREFVKNAPSFRARSKMPPFPLLSDADVDDVFAYFKYMQGHKAASK